ncbi:hypothetical protein TREES_T100000928 [Tupaia chinensis]|uniref:Uncharacterized protein n=1 Tax=Tupaia chinensis TaxID=246437 RepID=L9JC98_TUPCH|nr:hypothetical protein TREES_T100000928 [Tupaia chinensis]
MVLTWALLLTVGVVLGTRLSVFIQPVGARSWGCGELRELCNVKQEKMSSPEPGRSQLDTMSSGGASSDSPSRLPGRVFLPSALLLLGTVTARAQVSVPYVEAHIHGQGQGIEPSRTKPKIPDTHESRDWRSGTYGQGSPTHMEVKKERDAELQGSLVTCMKKDKEATELLQGPLNLLPQGGQDCDTARSQGRSRPRAPPSWEMATVHPEVLQHESEHTHSIASYRSERSHAGVKVSLQGAVSSTTCRLVLENTEDQGEASRHER